MKLYIVMIALFATTTIVVANDDGKAGRTSRFGDGCGDCHGIAVSTATSITVQGISQPLTVAPGSTTQFTIVVSHATQNVAGINIAVQDAEDDGAPIGQLTPLSGLRINGPKGELTHSAPQAMSAGAATFTFTWTAPTTEGTYYLQAIGNACNGNGSEDDGDAWSWMNPLPIIVSTPSSVDLSDEMYSGPADLILTDLSGSIVHTEHFDTIDYSANEGPQPTRHVAPGVYVSTLVHSNGVRRSQLILIR